MAQKVVNEKVVKMREIKVEYVKDGENKFFNKYVLDINGVDFTFVPVSDERKLFDYLVKK